MGDLGVQRIARGHTADHRRRAVSVTALVLAAAGGAAAQDTTGPATDTVLGAITVEGEGDGSTEGSGSYQAPVAASATGLPLSIRETPQAVSVVTAQRIADQNLQSTLDILAYTTGISAQTSETDRDSTYSRGFWVSNYIIDGMNIPTYQGWFSGVSLHSSTATVDRVEVLRGATGLLTGTGEPGAAVAITRKRAKSSEFAATTAVRAGSWDRYGGTLDVSTPVNREGTVRSRFILDAATEGSFVDRYSVDKQTYYGTIEADLTEATRLTFSLEHRNHDPIGSKWGGVPMVFSNGNRTHFGRSFSNAADWAHWSSWQTTAMAKLEHGFDNGWTADVTLSGVNRKYDAELLYMWGDLDEATGLGLNSNPWKGSDHNQLVALDASLTGPVQFLGRTHTLNFVLHGDKDWMKRDWPGYSGTPEEIGSLFDWTGDYPMPDWNEGDADWEDNRTKLSALASGRFSVTDSLHLVLGGRYTTIKTNQVFNYGEGFTEFEAFTPFAGAVWDLTDDWSLYASYSEVFEPQDYLDRNGNLLDPTVGKNREIGAKGELFDDRLVATLTYFDTYLDNVGTQDGSNLVPGTINPAYRGAKGVEARGLELEFAGEIAPGWNYFLGASTMDLKEGGEEFDTAKPRHTLKLFSTYTLPGALSQLTVGGGFRWQSETYGESTTGEGVTLRVTQPDYMVVDAMARYEFNARWSAQLNVNNVFDKSYLADAYTDSYYGNPLNAMLTVSARF